MKNKLELRMYILTPYNISPIQQGIQSLHGCVEYAQKHFKDSDYQDWAKNFKTVIILNGGTTNNGFNGGPGTMQMHLEALKKNKIKHSVFFEPDLNNALTAVCFLVNEKVFNRKKYPDYVEPFPTPGFKIKGFVPVVVDNKGCVNYKEWVKSIGGKQNEFLRDFLKPFRLA